jgi:uncharacterized protein YndB with AHSA1/START domain
MVSIKRSVIINRSIQDVFTFVTDIDNCPKWFPHIIESGRISPGPIGIGTTEYEVVLKYYFFIKVKNTSVVTDYQLNNKIERKISSPHFLPWSSIYSFKSVEGGTKLTYNIQWVPIGFYKLLTPIFVFIFTIFDLIIPLGNLKNLLESHKDNTDKLK